MAGDEEIDQGEYTTFLELFGVSAEDCCNAFQLISGVLIYLYVVRTRGVYTYLKLLCCMVEGTVNHFILILYWSYINA